MPSSLIVHVDDRAPYRETFRRLLEGKGYRLRGYEDSRAAAVELKTEEPFLAVVDSIGFEFARQLHKSCSLCRTVILSTEPPADAEFADAIVPKGSKDWLSQILERATCFEHEIQVISRKNLDLFADESICEALKGKIAVVGRKGLADEQIVQSFGTLNDAIAWLKQADRTVRYRIVQGPPVREISLEELEGAVR